MIEATIRYLPYLFLFLATVGPYVHITLKGVTSLKQQIDTFLIYIFVFLVGCQGIYAFFGHVFWTEETARSIGWPPSPRFQFEVGMANLAFGALGILSIWGREDFWKATAIGVSIFLWGDAYGHLKDIVLNHNVAPGNAGIFLFYDIFIPPLLFTLLQFRGLKGLT